LFGQKPFYFIKPITLYARDPKKLATWYAGFLELDRLTELDISVILLGKYDSEGSPIVSIQILALPKGLTEWDPRAHPILFTKKISKARECFLQRIATTSEIQSDSGGNQFFTFLDVEGNRIEVCQEPGT
jgi:hypothetical protein